MGEARRHKKFRLKRFLPIMLVIVVVLLVVYFYFIRDNHIFSSNVQKEYVSSLEVKVNLYDKDLNNVGQITKGTEIMVMKKSISDKKQNITYKEIKYDNKIYFLDKSNITDKKENIIKESKVYVRTPATIYEDLDKGTIIGITNKGTMLDVLGYTNIDKNGSIDAYKVSYNNGNGYIYGKYVVLNEADAILNYNPTKYYDVHQKRGNRFGGGNAGNLDYYPVTKPSFDDNIMPKKVFALYLNDASGVINNIDAYINYAKTTKINAFVVDIKDNQAPGYKSGVFQKYSPTNYGHANNTLESYKAAIKKIKNAGFYVIGRITTFNDTYYAQDNPDVTIRDTSTNAPYKHGGTYWPSPYQRKVWKFNVDLAKEAVQEMGFNEIQFDYVRFPDRTGADEKSGIIDFRNVYNEEKVQAIQRFLMYACDELHKLHVYVSADVFGESAYDYVTAYGQYWPALSNVVDVISGMPYPDHFNRNEFGFPDPVWTTPYKLLNYWASAYVAKRQTEIPTPAIARTWVQVYDVPNSKHPGGFHYGDTQIDEEIRALFDAGLTGGYMTWLSTSQLSRYQSQVNIYSKEY